jgi:hypothetical protein
LIRTRAIVGFNRPNAAILSQQATAYGATPAPPETAPPAGRRSWPRSAGPRR